MPVRLELLAGAVLAALLTFPVFAQEDQDGPPPMSEEDQVKDLIIAAPDLSALEDAKPEVPLSKEIEDRLARYLGRHIFLSEYGATLALSFSGAHLRPTYHDHLGHFMLVVSEWNVAKAGARPASLMLKYDAVMHEVRNHRATVQWLGHDRAARPIADFGLARAADGIVLDFMQAVGIDQVKAELRRALETSFNVGFRQNISLVCP